MSSPPMRILILGGTTEATQLATVLAGDARFEPTLSLAGRTASPKLPPIAHRIGGFGGVDGLARWLADHGTQAVIDATHPFAQQISANAIAAVTQAKLPLGSIVRPAWQAIEGDRWHNAASHEAAALALGATPARVFLSVGRLELSAYRASSQHAYLIRTIDAAEHALLPPNVAAIRERGPFNVAGEVELMRAHRIEVLVTKNSGGDATYAKIAAARRLGVTVVMIARPFKPAGVALTDANSALQWLEAVRAAHVASPSGLGSARGV
jgi:precorrin-6A/cobalt-precorrin-6A reductase